MAAKKRRQHRPEFKAKIALEAHKGQKTVNQIASENELAAVQVSQWKTKLIRGAAEVFGRSVSERLDSEEITAPLYQEIGRLKMELDCLKKNVGLSIDQKRLAIPNYKAISIRRQCELLGLNRSSWYSCR
jgi:putative transposase